MGISGGKSREGTAMYLTQICHNLTRNIYPKGGQSTPRTGLSSPKHGKEDDKPHVGGNQWAGGTGTQNNPNISDIYLDVPD